MFDLKICTQIKVKIWRFKALLCIKKGNDERGRSFLLKIADVRKLNSVENLLIAYTFYAQANHVQSAEFIRLSSETYEDIVGLNEDEKKHLIAYMHQLRNALTAYIGQLDFKLPTKSKYEISNVRGFLRHTFILLHGQ